MKITWIGHSCFKVEVEGASVVFDPYQDGSIPGLGPVRESADLVLCSHEHFDHNAAENITIAKAAETPGEPAFEISAIDTWHDDKEGSLRGENRIYIVRAGGYKIVHMGDIGCELTKEQLSLLQGADVLMIPIGGYYTIDAAQAARMAGQIAPAVIIPMHYRGKDFGFDVIGTVDEFVKFFPQAEIRGDSCFEIDKPQNADGAKLQPRVVVLAPAAVHD